MQKVIDQIAWMGERDFDTHALLNNLKSHQELFLRWGVMKVLICPRYVALRMRASRFNGWCVITQTEGDTYVADFLSTHGNPKYKLENLTDEDVARAIDLRAEWIPAYMEKLPEIVVDVEEQDL